MSISPGSGGFDPGWRPEPVPSRSRAFYVVLLVAVVILAATTAFLFMTLQSAQTQLADAAQKLQVHEEQIARLEDAMLRTSKQAEEQVSALRGEVTSTRGQIAQATKQVESQVLSKTQQIAEQLSAQQQAAVARVGSEVEQLKTVAATNESKLGSLTGDVSSVKNEVSQTKDELLKTIADLKSVKGDLGVQSGLIATNASELSALRRLGERNYFEFDLKKTRQPQRIGNVAMKLTRTDTRRNRYTLQVIADDKLTEKKDRTINEPVQFYVAKARTPYEIVVNQVDRDRIVGYLATPKDQGR